MSILFVCLNIILFITTLTAVVLSTCVGVGFCGYLISIVILRNSTHLCAVINKEANSASATDNITNFIIWTIVRIAPLKVGISTFSDRYICTLARLRAFSSFKYPVSE